MKPNPTRSLLIAALAIGAAALFIRPLTAAVDISGLEHLRPARPSIPDRTFTLTDFGAVADGATLNTKAFERAIAAVDQAGGGTLIVPHGVFRTLPFALCSRLNLHLDADAVIQAPDTFAAYGLPDPSTLRSQAEVGEKVRMPQPLIHGTGLHDVAITGTGTIDGNGALWWAWSERAEHAQHGRLIYPRAKLVVITGCKRLYVADITLTNSPKFHLVPVDVTDLTIERVKVRAPFNAPNTDAIDPGPGTRFLIRDCDLDTGDDDIVIKAGGTRILIENCTIRHGHGISIGSGTAVGISDMLVRDCTFDGTDNGIRIKSYRGNGGQVHNLQYSNIVMRHVRRPFDINMLYNGNAGLRTDVGPRQAKPGETKALPDFYDIQVSDLTVTGSPVAGRIIGLPELPAHHVTFTRVKIQAQRGFLVQDAKDITFDHAQIEAATGEGLVTDQATVDWNGKAVAGSTGGSPDPFY